MADRKLVVKIVGDESALVRSFRNSSRASTTFQRDIGRASRGALAGSGAFRAMGRSIAFASGGFLAFAGAGQFLRTSIDAAKEAQVTQAQLSAQFRASGQDLGVYQQQIDKTARRLSVLAGFENDQVKSAFTTIFRASGNVGKSLRDTALAADIARARHIDLAAAATIVAKVEGGNIGILRRAGVQVAKNATVEQALAVARSKFAGQALAGTTAQERFGAALHDTEEIIGTALLPTLNKFLISGTAWLQQMNESGDLQRKVASAADAVSGAVGGVVTVVQTADRITGSFKHTLELLIGLKFASVVAKWTLAMRAFTIASGEAGAAGAAALLLGRVRALARIGVLTLAFRFPGLAAGLSAIASLPGLIAAAATAAVVASSGDAPNVPKLPSSGRGFTAQRLAREGKIPTSVLVEGAKKAGLDPNTPAGRAFANPEFVAFVLRWAKDHGLVTPGVAAGGASAEALAKAARGLGLRASAVSDAVAARRGLNLTTAQRNTFFDNSITRILLRGGLGNLRQQLAAIQRASALITKRIAATKDITRKLNLEDQLLQLQSQGRDVRSQIADAARQRAQEARDRIKALAEQHQQRLQEIAAIKLAQRTSRQFRELGLSSTGDVITPSVQNLQKQLGTLSVRVTTPKLRSELARIRKVLSEGIVPKDVRAKIAELFDQIRGELGKGTKQLTKFRHVNANALIDSLGLNLTADQTRRLRQSFNQIGAGGTVPGSRSLAFAGAGTTVIPITLTLDKQVLTKVVTTHQRRQAQRRSDSRRGPYAGRH